MKLIEIYRKIIKYAGLTADDNGLISIASLRDGKNIEAIVSGKRLVLPLNEHLKNPDPENKIIFHPLTENVIRGESDTIMFLKKCINVRLNFVIGTLFTELFQLINSPELHKRLNPEQMELLKTVKDPDEKTILHFVSYLTSVVKNKPDSSFVNIFLKKGGIAKGGNRKGEKFSRLGVVSFPFYEELIENRTDSKFRVKDLDSYKQMYNFVFPGLDEIDSYSDGSHSKVAPYLDSLYKSSSQVTERINELVDLFEEFLELPDILRFNFDWCQDFQDLDLLIPEIRKIPVQASNEGNLQENKEVSSNAELISPITSKPQLLPSKNTEYVIPEKTIEYNKPININPLDQPAAIDTTKSNEGVDFKTLMMNANKNNMPMQQNQIGYMNPVYNQMPMQPPVNNLQVQQIYQNSIPNQIPTIVLNNGQPFIYINNQWAHISEVHPNTLLSMGLQINNGQIFLNNNGNWMPYPFNQMNMPQNMNQSMMSQMPPNWTGNMMQGPMYGRQSRTDSPPSWAMGGAGMNPNMPTGWR